MPGHAGITGDVVTDQLAREGCHEVNDCQLPGGIGDSTFQGEDEGTDERGTYTKMGSDRKQHLCRT